MLDFTGVVFDHWHAYRDGDFTRGELRTWMAPVRTQLEALLERTVAADIAEVSGSCADVLAHRLALWTFVDTDNVEPTNNHAERELRAYVLWRKRSFGSQSERVNRFAERLMTIAHTARKQLLDLILEVPGFRRAHPRCVPRRCRALNPGPERLPAAALYDTKDAQEPWPS
ncbi:MAG: hypothetical protein RLZZ450_7032 [Pseudomonadota bacterium]